MAERQDMTVGEDTVRSLIAFLRAYHAKEAPSGQNDGSNDTDDIHDDLEMNKGTTDIADLQGLYSGLNADERYDVGALALLGMDQVATLKEGRETARDNGQPGMSEFLEMPLSPQFLAEGLQRAGYPSGGHDPSRARAEDQHGV